MGLESIWGESGSRFTGKKKEGFQAKGTGCSCCATHLYEEEDVKREAINSLEEIMVAARYFKWDHDMMDNLVRQARKLAKERFSK